MRKTPFSILSAFFLCIILFSMTYVAAQQPVHGGTLTMCIGSDPPTLNPAMTTSHISGVVVNNVFDSLLDFDEKLNPVPRLAQKWEESSDGLTYTFHLVRNATWHDGVPFTSADVKYTVEEVASQRHPMMRTVARAIDTIETPDDYTVVFKMKEPTPYFILAQAPMPSGMIIPKHLYEGTNVTENPYNIEPIGTGPYKFVEWVKGSHIRLEKNEEYWKKDIPYIDQLIYRVIPDAAARVAALEAGEVDYITHFPGVDAPEAARLDKIEGISVKPGGAVGHGIVQQMWFNLRNEDLGKLKVRQAIQLAIDKEELAEKVTYGFGKSGAVMVSKDSPWHNPNIPMPKQDIEAAKKLLDEAGYKPDSNGIRLKFSALYVTGTFEYDKMAEILKEQLRQVGIDLELKPLDYAADREQSAAWKFDVYIHLMSTGPDPVISAYRFYHSDNIVNAPFQNLGGYKNTELDKVLDDAAKEINFEKRRDLYWKAQEIIFEDIPIIILFEKPWLPGWRDYVKNVVVEPYHYTSFADWWIEKATPTPTVTPTTTPSPTVTPTTTPPPSPEPSGIPMEYVGIIAIVVIALIAIALIRRRK